MTQPPMSQPDPNEPGAQHSPAPEVNNEVDAQTSDQDAPEDKNALPVTNGRKLVWVAAILVALYFIIQGLVGIVTGSDAAPAPAATVTQTAEVPQPTGEPVALPEDATTFASAMPETVRQYTRTSYTQLDQLPFPDAVEGHTLTYQGELDGATTTYNVLAVQFATPDEAAAAASERMGETPAEPVMIDEQEVGLLYLVQDTAQTLEPLSADVAIDPQTGQAVWTNATALFEVYGAVADLRNVTVGFPL
ncbi:hypothetical protein [Jonesia quinghaiensis]|uniref:hypothetical protein n=1 Tax=Jonesia quinghaiensis TaxID=262806 RepID=UPI0003F56DCE|nr:hypothetical protein [Jonesia quinghaiensis]